MGEISEKPLYVFKPENMGSNMSIDDKSIGHERFTVLSNSDTGKIALLVETTTAEGVESAMEKFGNNLQKIKNISMDMILTYSLVFKELVPRAIQVADKFHVMKYVYETVAKSANESSGTCKVVYPEASAAVKKTENCFLNSNVYAVFRTLSRSRRINGAVK